MVEDSNQELIFSELRFRFLFDSSFKVQTIIQTNVVTFTVQFIDKICSSLITFTKKTFDLILL